MKQLHLSALLLAFVFAGFFPAFLQGQERREEAMAQIEVRKAEIEAKRAEMDARREALRVEAEAKRAEMQARRIEFQQDIAQRKVERTERVFRATIERLRNIIARIESRMAKLEGLGGDISLSAGFIADAEVNLAAAEAKIDAFADLELNSEKARENFEMIRAAAAGAREDIRAAHRNLMMAVRALGAVQAEISASDEDEE